MKAIEELAFCVASCLLVQLNTWGPNSWFFGGDKHVFFVSSTLKKWSIQTSDFMKGKKYIAFLSYPLFDKCQIYVTDKGIYFPFAPYVTCC